MTMKLFFASTIQALSGCQNIMSIGKSGGEKLPESNESDVDVFVFCDQVPDRETRVSLYRELGKNIDINASERSGRFWGICDFLAMGQDEICLMYFTVADMDKEILSVLEGSRLDREGEYFYATGRCATILSMHILYEKTGYIANLKEKLAVYPQALSKKLVAHHMRRINDIEDFERAVSRKEVLFYHATLESAMDHYLQGLFALNLCFFPSRKRSIQYIEGFKSKPEGCSERLLKTIELGAKAESLGGSYAEWCSLCNDLKRISASVLEQSPCPV